MKHILDDTLNQIAQASGWHERTPEFGERAWLVKGKYAGIIYWDMGNGWCDIIKIIPKEGYESWLQEFFDKAEASDDI